MNDGLDEYPTREQIKKQEDEERRKRLSRISDDTISLRVGRDSSYSSYAKETEHFPTRTVYAAIYTTQYSYDSGYGHNGASDMCTGTSTEIVYFRSDEALEEWVIKATRDNKVFKIVQLTPVETEVKAVFSVKK